MNFQTTGTPTVGREIGAFMVAPVVPGALLYVLSVFIARELPTTMIVVYAYLATWCFAVPVYFVVKDLRPISPPLFASAGALIGCVSYFVGALLVSNWQFFEVIHGSLLPITIGAGYGTLAASTFWFLISWRKS